MKEFLLCIFLVAEICIPFVTKGSDPTIADPLILAKRIGDKLIRETPFAYRLELASEIKEFKGIQMIDFGRNFKVAGKTSAYAYTQLQTREAMEMEIQLGHNDGCSIWLNGQLVYQSDSDKKLELIYDERSIGLPFHFNARLNKGSNSLLIKSVTNRPVWRVYLQPPSEKGAVLSETPLYPEIGLGHMKRVDKRISEISNWLIIGPFNGSVVSGETDLPKDEPVFGQIFQGLEGPVSWGIPKIDVVGNLIDSLPWGTNYNWNYHNGGVAWAMKMLGEMTGETKYEKYANDFCDFQLKSIPFLEYETETLGKVNVPNGFLINTPLLDFTLAPSLPLIYRLRKDSDFGNRKDYLEFVNKMLHYARYDQIRLPGSTVYTRTTPKKYTTWVDDMFMGIPFLIQAAMYSENMADRSYYFNDAASQILDYNKEVWDVDAKLYFHARFSESNEKMLHWSRANGWAIWAITEVLLYLPKDHPKFKAILKHFQTYVASLVTLQDNEGLWHNVLDSPESRHEVSGSAIFTMAIARGITEGWISDKKYRPIVQKAWDAITTQIGEDGTVSNICYGTMCSSDLNYYLNRPFYDNDTHGLFAVIFAAMEVSKMQNHR